MDAEFSMHSIDRHARKQVLLTRIAFERIELRRQVAQVRDAAQLPQLLRAAVGGGGLGRRLFGAGPTAQAGGWLGFALQLLRRYRVAAALLGGVAPTLRGRGRWRRLLRLGLLGAAAWFGWRAARDRPR